MSLGGTEISVYHLARTQGRTHEVFVTFPYPGIPESRDRFSYRGFRVLTLPPAEVSPHRKLLRPLSADSVSGRGALRLLRSIDPDVVHVHQLQDVPLEIVERSIEEGRRVFFTLRDYWYLCARTVLVKADRSLCDGPHRDFRNCEECWRATAIERLGGPSSLPLPFAAIFPVARGLRGRTEGFLRLLNGAERVVAPSRFLLEKHAEYGVRRDRLLYLQNGIDLAPYAGFRRSAAPKTRFGYVGSLTPEKGVHVAVEAAGIGGFDLTVFGPFDPDAVPYHATLQRRGAGTVRFAGRFDDPADAFSRLDCLIVPSLWVENCPAVVLQAWATRTPVLASDLGALRELVEPGKTGLLFRPGDARHLAQSMAEAEDRTRRDSWGRALPTPKSIEENARELLALYPCASHVTKRNPPGYDS